MFETLYIKLYHVFFLDMFIDLQFKRYKYIVNVVLGEQHGAGVKVGTRCIWDAEADTYAYDSFINVRMKQILLQFSLFFSYHINDFYIQCFYLFAFF